MRDARKTVTVDVDMIERARIKAKLPEGVTEAAILRYALAVLAGEDKRSLALQLDSTRGRGSVRRKMREAARRAAGPVEGGRAA